MTEAYSYCYWSATRWDAGQEIDCDVGQKLDCDVGQKLDGDVGQELDGYIGQENLPPNNAEKFQNSGV